MGRWILPPIIDLNGKMGTVYPALPASLARYTKSNLSLLSGVYSKKSNGSHTCLTCGGFYILPGQQCLYDADQTECKCKGNSESNLTGLLRQ